MNVSTNSNVNIALLVVAVAMVLCFLLAPASPGACQFAFATSADYCLQGSDWL